MKHQKLAPLMIAMPFAVAIYIVLESLFFFFKSFRILRNPAPSLLAFTLLFASTAIAAAPKADLSHPYQEAVVYHPDMKVREIMLSLGKIQYGEDNVQALDNLITHESHFDPHAINPNGGACGLGQAVPCKKLLDRCGSLDNVSCQISWTLDYIKDRYGNPNNAWKFWLSRRPIEGRDVGNWY